MGTVDRSLVRDVAAIAAAAGVIGASFGAIAVAAGLSVWLASLMSMLVFAGGAQFMAVGVVAGGGSPVAAVLAGLLLNARHLPFGLAIADVRRGCACSASSRAEGHVDFRVPGSSPGESSFSTGDFHAPRDFERRHPHRL